MSSQAPENGSKNRSPMRYHTGLRWTRRPHLSPERVTGATQ